jgi:hypothetical protein
MYPNSGLRVIQALDGSDSLMKEAIMSYQDAKAVAEIIAIAVGGAWAIYGFIVLQKRNKVTTELRKMELESQKTALETCQIELQLRRIAVVRVDISAATFRQPDGSGYCILADVSLTNTGSRETRIEWDRQTPAFFVRHASFAPDGVPSFHGVQIGMCPCKVRNANETPTSTIIRAGATEHLAFAAQVEKPGIYLLSFRGPLDPKEQAISKEAGATSTTAWTAHHYIPVPQAPSPLKDA